jgi:undecaprenyl-diphosphatase
VAVGAGLSVWDACLLGAVQGVSEVLPLTGGSLALGRRMVATLAPDERLAVSVALQLGTLLAVLGYFGRDVWRLGSGLFPPRRRDSTWPRLWLLVVGTVPGAVLGAALRFAPARIESWPLTGTSLVLTGALLYLATAVRGALRGEDSLRTGDAVVIGCFHALSLLPGVPRTGTTISGGLFRQARADVAARFSFLLAVPAIAGALAVEAPAIARLAPEAHGPLLAGIGVATLTGVAAIAAVLHLVRRGRLHWLAYTCWAVGAAVLAAGAVGAA